MKHAPWPLRWFGPLLIATAPADAAPPTDSPDPPSIELLEYLAEFELDNDGRLLDPLDMRRDSRDQDTATPTPSRSTSR